jgi:hypothetical protein
MPAATEPLQILVVDDDKNLAQTIAELRLMDAARIVEAVR